MMDHSPLQRSSRQQNASGIIKSTLNLCDTPPFTTANSKAMDLGLADLAQTHDNMLTALGAKERKVRRKHQDVVAAERKCQEGWERGEQGMREEHGRRRRSTDAAGVKEIGLRDAQAARLQRMAELAATREGLEQQIEQLRLVTEKLNRQRGKLEDEVASYLELCSEIKEQLQDPAVCRACLR
jgi:chromosome segregation ATPase